MAALFTLGNATDLHLDLAGAAASVDDDCLILAVLVILGAVADLAGDDLGFADWVGLDAGATGVLAAACLGGAGLGSLGEAFLAAPLSLTTARATAFLDELEGLLEWTAALPLLSALLPETDAVTLVFFTALASAADALGFFTALGSAAVAVGSCESLLRLAAAATGAGLMAACTLLKLVGAVAGVPAVPAALGSLALFLFFKAGPCAVVASALRFAERILSTERVCPLAGCICPLQRGICLVAAVCCPLTDDCSTVPLPLLEDCGLLENLLPSACA